MRRIVEKASPEQIQVGLGLDAKQFHAIISRPAFANELQAQCEWIDRTLHDRLETLSSEALDVVRDVMRNAVSPSYRLQAAKEILDRAGYVKVEKRINITADAEEVIKHLNQDHIEITGGEVEEAQLVEVNEFDEIAAEIEIK